MADERFAQHHGDALAAKNSASAALTEIDDADGWMSAVWYVKDGRVHLLRTTHRFPRGDFELAEAQFHEMNRADAAEDLAVATALPLPFANRTSPAVEAVNGAVGKLNGQPVSLAKSREYINSEGHEAAGSADPVQQTSKEKIKKAIKDETID